MLYPCPHTELTRIQSARKQANLPTGLGTTIENYYIKQVNNEFTLQLHSETRDPIGCLYAYKEFNKVRTAANLRMLNMLSGTFWTVFANLICQFLLTEKK